MIEVTLLCDLLALVLNIPHLGCDRLSDPAGITPVYLGHTVTIIVYYIFVCPNKGPPSILCYIFVCPNKGPRSLSVTFLAPNVGPRSSSVVTACLHDNRGTTHERIV